MEERVAGEETRKVGRPPLAMPESIEYISENVTKTAFRMSPRKRGEWKFLQPRAQSCLRADGGEDSV